MKRLVLFVAYINDDFKTGLTYAAEFARLMGKDMAMLVIDNSGAIHNFEKIMTAVTFAEANEFDTVAEILSIDNGYELEKKIKWFREMCNELGIAFSIYKSQLNMLKAISEFVLRKKGVDVVLLGTSVTENRSITSSALNKLVRVVSRPVVTMTRQVSETGNQQGKAVDDLI